MGYSTREEDMLYLQAEIKERGVYSNIGSINNYYGGLQVAALEGKYYWSIMDYCESIWEEIPFELYVNLVDFEEGRA